MKTLKDLISQALRALAVKLFDIANRLSSTAIPKVTTIKPEEEINLMDAGKKFQYERYEKPLAEHPTLANVSFEEGLKSDVFTVRHNVATQIISWYLGMEKGEVAEYLLVRAAEVLLETVAHHRTDELELVGIWRDIRNAPLEDVFAYDAAYEAEHKFYDRLERTMERQSLPAGRLDA